MTVESFVEQKSCLQSSFRTDSYFKYTICEGPTHKNQNPVHCNSLRIDYCDERLVY